MYHHIKCIVDNNKALLVMFFVKIVICDITSLLSWKTRVLTDEANVGTSFEMIILQTILLTFVGAAVEVLLIYFLGKLKISKGTVMVLFVWFPFWNIELYFLHNFTAAFSILFFVASIFGLTEMRNKGCLYLGMLCFSLAAILDFKLCFFAPIIFFYIYRTRRAKQAIFNFFIFFAFFGMKILMANIELLDIIKVQAVLLQNGREIPFIVTLTILVFAYIECYRMYFHTKCSLFYFLCISSIAIIVFNPFNVSAFIVFCICFIMVMGYITNENKLLLAMIYAFEILLSIIFMWCKEKQYIIAFDCVALTGYLVLCYEIYSIITKNDFTFKRGVNPFIIGIGGDSGAGKSSLIQLIRQLLTTDESAVFIEGDGDHKWERGDKNWNNYTALDPEANYLYRQAYDIISLRKHTSVYRSEYDHRSGKFTEAHRIRNGKYIVLSGLHALFLPLLRKELDLKIYLDTDEDLQKYWKIKRDKKERGYSVEEILSQIEKRHDDAEEYIYPQKQYAGLIIRYFDNTLEDLYQEDHEEILSVNITLSIENNLEQLIDELNKYGLNVCCEISKDFNWQTVMINGMYLRDRYIDFEKIAQTTIPLYKEIFLFKPDWQTGIKGIVQLFLAVAIGKKLRSDV